jgi:putative effector of murein hydrolase
MFYIRRFVRNLREKQRVRNVLGHDLPAHTIFSIPLTNAWRDIKRRWRNLLIKTYAGVTMTRWLKAYRSMDYNTKIKQLFIGNKNKNAV